MYFCSFLSVCCCLWCKLIDINWTHRNWDCFIFTAAEKLRCIRGARRIPCSCSRRLLQQGQRYCTMHNIFYFEFFIWCWKKINWDRLWTCLWFFCCCLPAFRSLICWLFKKKYNECTLDGWHECLQKYCLMRFVWYLFVCCFVTDLQSLPAIL